MVHDKAYEGNIVFNENERLTMRKVIRAKDIVGRFGYSPYTASSYLSYIARQVMTERKTSYHLLAKKRTERPEKIRGYGFTDLLIAFLAESQR